MLNFDSVLFVTVVLQKNHENLVLLILDQVSGKLKY